ncbi:glutamate racemase [Flavobacterium croceum DSM 17960]|uniref:Glutamate racemase n=1 Tax=Flavobacterium croceum DSM 17960 TaxID=1121886 RepID=A0A2S4N6R0_9FLAO|nr:glutamate racemase [Flavobacterium croceum]POS01419.1 glutamate racemase [Flavobacterium croceum DSM 17960]
MANNNPIGLFDSGIGGTSIWKEVHKLMPYENTIYLADSKNAPYGNKSKEEILSLSCKNTEYLLNQNCKLIIVACNTATTNAIKELRAKYKVPFIGIEPAIKPAALHSKTQKIGILATKGTLNSELFHKNLEKYQDIQIIEQIGYNLVERIENGFIDDNEMFKLLQMYVQPMIQKNIDYLVLGCTHYPYLIPQLQKIVPAHIKIIDSGEAVAKQTLHVLEQQNLLKRNQTAPTLQFITNGNPTIISNILQNQYTVTFKDF